MQRGTEGNSDPRHSRHSPTRVKHAIHTIDADGNHRNVQFRGYHSDAWLEGRDFAAAGHYSFGEDQDTPFFIRQLADVAQRFECSRLALRDWKTVEQPRRQVIVQAVGKASAVEMLVEEFL